MPGERGEQSFSSAEPNEAERESATDRGTRASPGSLSLARRGTGRSHHGLNGARGATPGSGQREEEEKITSFTSFFAKT